jgi:hypothetical protein
MNDSALPRIDALQLEVSSQLRDDPVWAAERIAAAVCESLGPRFVGEKTWTGAPPQKR